MNRWGVAGSAAVVAVANAVILVGVAIDRAGGIVQKIELTERELPVWGGSEDDTGIAVRLLQGPQRRHVWLDRAKLAELGFDCSVPATGPSADWRFRRQPARRAFVAMEYNDSVGAGTEPGSRLVVIDAGRNAAALRAKYPDQSRYLIAPALIRPNLRYEVVEGRAVVGTYEVLLAEEIHVPQPYARTLAGLRGKPYHLTLCYGKRYEPWICGCRP